MTTRRMTVAQALVEFLSVQFTVDGNSRQRSIAGMFGILGHGNVAGVGQAVAQLEAENPGAMPYHQARNEQAMVHQAVGYARMHRRRATYASSASVGPGSTNMLTGAALATTNRLPALLLPSDTFATRRADPVLQQLEQPWDTGLTVNDAFRPLSRYFDRVSRPEQLFPIALSAMRVLLDPVETGAVTISLPQDVQTEALDVPLEFLRERDWVLRRPRPDRDARDRAVAAIMAAQRPVIVAGGGVIYSEAEGALAQFVEATGIPVATTQAGGGALPWNHPQYLGGAGATGSTASNRMLAAADLIIGIGTRYSDFTTGSGSAFQNPEVAFVNINVAPFDANKYSAQVALVADAREALNELVEATRRYRVAADYAAAIDAEKREWDQVVDAAREPSARLLPGQPEIIGAVQAAAAPDDVVVQAAGSLPGDLQKLWRVSDPLGYHVEYAFSCMGYEIAGGLGVKRGALALGSNRDVIVMVGDGSFLMLSSELATAVADGVKIIVIVVQNHGYASIGHLSETVGSERFGTRFRHRDTANGSYESGEKLPVDLAMNARSYGVDVTAIPPGPGALAALTQAVAAAKASSRSTVITIDSDPHVYAPSGEGWWDVPVAEVSTVEATQRARERYVAEARERRAPRSGRVS